MEEYLKDIKVWCWRYRKPNFRDGLNFTAKPNACDAIIKCLGQLQKEGNGVYRTIPLQLLRPEDEAKVSGGQKFESFSRLRITLHAESERIRQMSFREDEGIVFFDFTSKALPKFELRLANVKAGQGDCSIGPEEAPSEERNLGELDRLSSNLWFWPCFGHLWVVE